MKVWRVAENEPRSLPSWEARCLHCVPSLLELQMGLSDESLSCSWKMCRTPRYLLFAFMRLHLCWKR